MKPSRMYFHSDNLKYCVTEILGAFGFGKWQHSAWAAVFAYAVLFGLLNIPWIMEHKEELKRYMAEKDAEASKASL